MSLQPPHLPPHPGSVPLEPPGPWNAPTVVPLTGAARRALTQRGGLFGVLALGALMTGVSFFTASWWMAWLGLPLALGWTLFSLVLATRSLAARSQNVLIHEHGLALEEHGRVCGPLFWRDLTNVLSSPNGVLQVSSREVQWEIRCADLEQGPAVRERIETEYNNLWGTKITTFADLGYFYGDGARRGMDEQRRKLSVLGTLLLLTTGDLLVMTGANWWAGERVAMALVPLLGAVLAGVLFVGSLRLVARCARWGKWMAETGGIQLGERDLKVFSRDGALRVIAFEDIEALEALPGAPIRLRLRVGEWVTVLRSLSYFEKFRVWLIDAAREQGVKVVDTKPTM